MIEQLFIESLKEAAQLREHYLNSLGNKTDNWEKFFGERVQPIPELFRAIYSNVSGTRREIAKQEWMDFCPGYRLIHISELVTESSSLRNVVMEEEAEAYEMVLPILANYSSDYICYCKSRNGEEKICSLTHDFGELTVMHSSPEKFLATICEFYKQGVYFLDSDGYLDYDMDKKLAVGFAINPDISYWHITI
jgi:hypothetical protein